MKVRLATVAVLALGLATQPAAAANLSGAKCESPELISLMESQFRSSSSEGHSLVSQGVHIEKITKSVTSFSSSNKLVCTITFRASYGGETINMRARFTYEQFAGGKLTAKVVPF